MSPSWMQVALFAFGAALLMWIGKYLLWMFRGLPPGPLEFPLAGSIPFLLKESRITLAKIGKKYGGIFLIHFGMTPAVIVTDGKLIREVLLIKGSDFVGRPDFFTARKTFHDSDVAFSHHKQWRDLKSFMKNTLNKFGYNKITIEPVVSDGAQHLTEKLNKFDSQVISLYHSFIPYVLSVTWNMITGKSFCTDDSKMIKLYKEIDTVFQFVNPSSPLNFFPSLRFIFPNSFHLKAGLEASDDIDAMIQEEINTFTFTNDKIDYEAQTFIEAYLQEKHRREVETLAPFNRTTLLCLVKDLLFGGIHTSDTTIKWGILYLMHYQEVQTKLQDELDEVIGPNQYPCYSDRYKLPYATAVLMEINRISSIVQFGAPHQCIRTTTLGGYKIPAGMAIYPNLWAMHHDPFIWGDPETFRPERFLDENGKVARSDFLLPFGAGPRACPGQGFGSLVTFIFITTLFQRFQVSIPPGVIEKDPRCFDPIEGLILTPPPYSVFIRRRIPISH